MKKHNKIYYRIIFVTMCFVLSSVFMLISGAESLAKSKGIKLRYNGKTSVNRSKQMSVTYQNKKVSKKSYPAVVIKKNYMVSYADVFKKGMKVSCKYKKERKGSYLIGKWHFFKNAGWKKDSLQKWEKSEIKSSSCFCSFCIQEKD